MSELLFQEYLPNKAAYLQACKKNQLALLSTSTNVKMSAALRQSIGCSKVVCKSTRYVRLNADYLKLANKERARLGLEPLTKRGSLPWGEWVIPNILLAHRPDADDEPNFYLRYYRDDSGEFDDDSETEYYIDNVMVGQDDPKIRAIFEERKQRGNGMRPVCNNVSWRNIVSLDLCKKSGEPDIAIV